MISKFIKRKETKYAIGLTVALLMFLLASAYILNKSDKPLSSEDKNKQYVEIIQQANEDAARSEFDTAIEKLNEAVGLADTEEERRHALTRIGATYLQKGDYLRSEEVFMEAEAEFGNEWLAITEGLANSYIGLFHFDTALTYLEKSVEIAKSDLIVAENKKELIENYENQVKELKDRASQLPYSKQAALHIGKALSYEARGDKQKAVEEYELALELVDHEDPQQHDYAHEIEDKIEELKT